MMERRILDDQGLTRAQRYVRSAGQSETFEPARAFSAITPDLLRTLEKEPAPGADRAADDPENGCFETAWETIFTKLSGQEFTQAMDAAWNIQQARQTGEEPPEADWKTLETCDRQIAGALKTCLEQLKAGS